MIILQKLKEVNETIESNQTIETINDTEKIDIKSLKGDDVKWLNLRINRKIVIGCILFVVMAMIFIIAMLLSGLSYYEDISIFLLLVSLVVMLQH